MATLLAVFAAGLNCKAMADYASAVALGAETAQVQLQTALEAAEAAEINARSARLKLRLRKHP